LGLQTSFKPSNRTARGQMSSEQERRMLSGLQRTGQQLAAGNLFGDEQQCKRVPSFTSSCTCARTYGHVRTQACSHACMCSSEGQKALAYARIVFISKCCPPHIARISFFSNLTLLPYFTHATTGTAKSRTLPHSLRLRWAAPAAHSYHMCCMSCRAESWSPSLVNSAAVLAACT
jgi:hypothetical protein